jgi:hypothetical protein
VQQAKGTYVHLLDDDDLIDPDFVEVCMEATAGAPDVGVVRTGMRLVAGEQVVREFPNRAAGLSLEEFFRAWFAGKVQLYQCCTVFHTARLQEVGGFGPEPDLLCDDTAIVNLAARWRRVDVEEVKASFRRHVGTFGRSSKTAAWCRDSLRLLETMQTLVPLSAEQIGREGRRFFAGFNYRQARGSVAPGFPRLRAYWTVFRAFGFRYPPPYTLVQWLLSARRYAFGARQLD